MLNKYYFALMFHLRFTLCISMIVKIEIENEEITTEKRQTTEINVAISKD